jgi:hypothetical protein
MAVTENDIEINDEDVVHWGISFAKVLDKLAELHGSVVTLTGAPTALLRKSGTHQPVTDWATLDATVNAEGTRVDVTLNPPSGTDGLFELEVRCDHSAGGHAVAKVLDRYERARRLIRIRVFK